MLNWIACDRTVKAFKLRTSFKLRTYDKLNFLKYKCFCMLNWIVWKKLFLTLKLYFRLTELFEIEPFWHLTVSKQKLYLY